jgi:hypothetical protein
VAAAAALAASSLSGDDEQVLPMPAVAAPAKLSSLAALVDAFASRVAAAPTKAAAAAKENAEDAAEYSFKRMPASQPLAEMCVRSGLRLAAS